jgi:hypothetical protein
VYAHGGLGELRSVLASPFVYAPHDALVPGALTVGDLPDLAAALAPQPVRLEGLVDGANRPLPEAAARDAYRPALAAYKEAGRAMNFSLTAARSAAASWVRDQLSQNSR